MHTHRDIQKGDIWEYYLGAEFEVIVPSAICAHDGEDLVILKNLRNNKVRAVARRTFLSEITEEDHDDYDSLPHHYLYALKHREVDKI